MVPLVGEGKGMVIRTEIYSKLRESRIKVISLSTWSLSLQDHKMVLCENFSPAHQASLEVEKTEKVLFFFICKVESGPASS